MGDARDHCGIIVRVARARAREKGVIRPVAVPKRKTSKASRDSRRAHWKAQVPNVSECPQCHQPKLPHRVCPECGFYNNREAVETE